MTEQNTENWISDSINFVQETFESFENYSELKYHNWEHTLYVYNSVKQIIKYEQDLTENDKIALRLAAIFHDIGYLEGCENHEKKGAEIAINFLQKNTDIPSEICTQIVEIIKATRLDYLPKNLPEKIIRDADLAHLADENYADWYQKLFEELNDHLKLNLSKAKWRKMSIEFIINHQYNTDFARQNYEPQKAKNLIDLISKMESFAKKKPKKKKKEKTPKPAPKSTPKVAPKEIKKDDKKIGRGVETLFRVAIPNHIALSNIADNKANTLISVNAIIISILLSSLFPKILANKNLLYPAIIFLLSTVTTIIFAILSTMPKVSKGNLTRSDILSKKGNLIFFGNFYHMSINEYEWAIEELLQDPEYLYKTLTRDLYYLGLVLDKKYRLLRTSYVIFIVGLVISCLSFIIMMYIQKTM